MSELVQTRLINEPFSDPGVFIDFQFGKRAILFDVGDLAPLSARELLRVTHIFVTHRHMDHFAGFDRLLRVTLYRPGVLRFVGPPGLIDGIAAKLHGYVWNLLDADSPDFAIFAAEFDGGRIGPWTRFRAWDAFRASDGGASDVAPGLVLSEPDLWIECSTLDHGTPCLAFSLQERLRVNVWRAGLDRLGLPVGVRPLRARQDLPTWRCARCDEPSPNFSSSMVECGQERGQARGGGRLAHQDR